MYVWWQEVKSNSDTGETRMDFLEKAGTVLVTAAVGIGSLTYATRQVDNPPLPPLPVWLLCLLIGFSIFGILYDLYYWQDDDAEADQDKTEKSEVQIPIPT